MCMIKHINWNLNISLDINLITSAYLPLSLALSFFFVLKFRFLTLKMLFPLKNPYNILCVAGRRLCTPSSGCAPATLTCRPATSPAWRPATCCTAWRCRKGAPPTPTPPSTGTPPRPRRRPPGKRERPRRRTTTTTCATAASRWTRPGWVQHTPTLPNHIFQEASISCNRACNKNVGTVKINYRQDKFIPDFDQRQTLLLKLKSISQLF